MLSLLPLLSMRLKEAIRQVSSPWSTLVAFIRKLEQ